MIESLFSHGSGYETIVDANIFLHQEAAQLAEVVLANWSKERGDSISPIKVLDLGCGGQPLIISNALKALENTQFEYTGMDSNSDQVMQAQGYPFPSNVKPRILQGDIWSLPPELAL